MNKNKNIEFVVKGKQFIFPLNGKVDWNFEVVGEDHKGNIDNTDGKLKESEIYFEEDKEHTIVLSPGDDEYRAGWGKAFNFGETTEKGYSSLENKARLVRILSNPDWAHMESEKQIGKNFKAKQFYECVNLDLDNSNLTEDLSDEELETHQNVTNFRYMQYYKTKGGTIVSDEF